MNTQESNKMIAEFMGLAPNECGVYQTKRGPYHLENLSYHLSWDWLMPVIRKINEVSKYDDYCKDRLHLQRMLDECINENTIGRLEVYNAVVEFINQYNKTK
jgi:hypothetical protein